MAARLAARQQEPEPAKIVQAEAPVQRRMPADKRRKAEALEDRQDFQLEARLLKKLKRGTITEVRIVPGLGAHVGCVAALWISLLLSVGDKQGPAGSVGSCRPRAAGHSVHI